MYIYSVLYAFDDRTVNDSLTSFARVLPAEGHPRRGNARVPSHLAVRRSFANHKNENKQKRVKRIKRKNEKKEKKKKNKKKNRVKRF